MKDVLTDSEKFKIEQHRMYKCAAKTERDLDRQNEDKSTAIISYDLQNVFCLPKAEVSNFFYKRKFLVYNLTGHCNLNKTTYCSIWTEVQSGRSGSDIPSALRKILNQVATDNSNISKIILWSDSCVPQNKNRVNSMMVLKFLEEHPNIKKNRT